MHQKVCIRITTGGANTFRALRQAENRQAVSLWPSLATSAGARETYLLSVLN
jgi:hypothetical protein